MTILTINPEAPTQSHQHAAAGTRRRRSFALVAAVATHFYVIRKEEMHLLARFGYEFERYCRRTRVWI